jgi:hypothetical protein
VSAATAIGAVAFLASGPAAAFDLGPVSVPISVPPVNVPVTIPPVVVVGPVAVPTGQIAPGLGAAVTVSPENGVDADVTLPASVGVVPLPTGTDGSVHVGIGPGGVTIDAPVIGVTAPGIPQPGVPPRPGIPGIPQPQVPGSGSASPTTPGSVPSPAANGSASTPGAARRGVLSSGSADPATGAAPASTPGDVPAAHISGVPGEELRGPVNASLQHPEPERSSMLWRAIDAIASRQGLLIALLVIVLVGRFAASGLLRDAVRRTGTTRRRSVSAS